jgi:hypothetical protein
MPAPLLPLEDDVGFDFRTAGQNPALPVPPSPRRRQSAGLWMGVIVASILVMIGGLVLVTMSRPAEVARPPDPTPPWDKAHRAELTAMKNDAERLAASGQLQQSLAEYNKLLATVADHDISDPATAGIVAAARADQSAVFAAVLASQQSTSAAVVPELPSPPPSPSPSTAPVTAVAAPATQPDLAVGAAAPTTAPVITASTQPESADPVINAADTAPPLPNPPPPVSLHAYTMPDGVTDEEIGDAITKGVAYLRSHFDTNGQIIATDDQMPGIGNLPMPGGGVGPFGDQRSGRRRRDDNPPPMNFGPSRGGPGGPGGPGGMQMGGGDIAGAYSTPGFDALSVYALLQAGQAMDPKILDARDPFAQLILDRLKKYDLTYTYHRSLRAAALAVLNRKQDTHALEEDVSWLISANREGAYTYTAQQGGYMPSWDNSNSQYGLLGVWSGAQSGLAVPANYWQAVDNHWSNCAINGGTWGYFANSVATLSMTFAGIASELVSRDYLNAPNGPADAGLAWLDAGDNCTEGVETSMSPSYTLYGLERVGLASGYKYFGRHDWYSEFAQKIVAEQHFDGSWGTGDDDSLVDTAYYLLFLARGRHPILFNKLRYEGNWDAHSRDVMHLARYAGKQLERPLNWQIVNLHRNWFDWLDSPVLYISGTTPPNFSDAEYDALRSFSEAGGLIFTEACGDSLAFNKWVATAAHKIFPRYELLPVPKDDPLYSVVYKLKKPPPLLSISNGSRLLLIHAPTDIAKGWQLDWSETYGENFKFGVNLFVYAAGKSLNLKHRLASTYIPAPPENAATSQSMTVLRYAGAWNPEPYAYTRFARYFQWETHTGLNVATVDLKSLQPNSTPLAVLTGTVANDFTNAEVTAARDFVDAGGVLVIDACGGQAPFASSVHRSLIARAFPDASLLPVPEDYPALVPSRPFADDLRKPLYRTFTLEQLGRLPLLGFSSGRGRVLFSRLDLTTGLLGTQSWGILGFDPAYSQALMKNLVLWSNARSVPPPATAPTN